MTYDTRENEGPSFCEDCNEDYETCWCEEQECLEAMREAWMDGMRESHE